MMLFQNLKLQKRWSGKNERMYNQQIPEYGHIYFKNAQNVLQMLQKKINT